MIVGDIVYNNARLYPDKLAIVDKESRFTWQQVDYRTNRLANSLTGLGLRKGDRIAIIAENNHYYGEFLLAVGKNGLIGSGVSYRHLPPQMADIINDCAPRALLVQDKFAVVVNQARSQIKGVDYIIGMGKNHGYPLDYETLLAQYPQDKTEFTAEPEDICNITYTTGTTGAPKGAIYRHQTWKSLLLIRFLVYHLSPDDVYLVHGPLYLAGGLQHFITACLGGGTVIVDSFDAQRFVETIEREKVSVSYLLPIHYRLIREYLDTCGRKYDLTSLKKLSFGGGQAAPAAQVKEVLDYFGRPWSNKLYSMTEGVVSFLMPNDIKAGLSPQATEKEWRRLDSVGKPILATQVRIVNDNDEDVPTGETGEVLVKSDAWMNGYWNKPELTADAMRGGWYHTSDMGTLDEDGFLYLMGRKDFLIKSGGMFIAPKQVEDALLLHPAVAEAAVIGVPDDKWGQVAKAIVALKAGQKATEKEMRDHCRKHLPGYQVPKTVVFVDKLPKDPAYGKVSVKELKRLYG